MSASDRIVAAIRALIALEFPRLRFLGVYEYVVQAASVATVDVAPTDTTIGLPSLSGLPLSSSILGEAVSGAAVGAVALVQFVNGDPGRPEVVSLSLPSKNSTVDATGTLSLGPSATLVKLAGGTAPVARRGDAVTVYLGSTPLNVSGTINGTSAFVGTILFSGPAVGIIAAGNPKVTA